MKVGKVDLSAEVRKDGMLSSTVADKREVMAEGERWPGDAEFIDADKERDADPAHHFVLSDCGCGSILQVPVNGKAHCLECATLHTHTEEGGIRSLKREPPPDELPPAKAGAFGYHDGRLAAAIMRHGETLNQAARLDQISQDIRMLEAQLHDWGIVVELPPKDGGLGWMLIKRGRGKAWRIVCETMVDGEPEGFGPFAEAKAKTRLACATLLPDLVDRLAQGVAGG